MTRKNLLAAILSLPEGERAGLARQVLKSLDKPPSAWEAKWAAESERRLAEVRAGTMSERPAEEVFADERPPRP